MIPITLCGKPNGKLTANRKGIRMSSDGVKFQTIHPDGTISNIRVIKQSDILRCPFAILVPSHYREDGSCKCDDPQEREMMIREWGYTEDDFKKNGLL